MNDEELKQCFRKLRAQDSRSTPEIHRLLPARGTGERERAGGFIWRFAVGAIGIASLALLLVWPDQEPIQTAGHLSDLEHVEGLLLASWDAPSDSLLESTFTEFDLQFLLTKN